MHLKEVVNLHWTLRKGIKLGRGKYVSSRPDNRFFDAGFVRYPQQQLRKRAQSVFHQENNLAGIYAAIESINLRREEAKTWGTWMCVSTEGLNVGGTMFVPPYFSRSDKRENARLKCLGRLLNRWI